MDLSTCPNCHIQVLPVFYFCPNCGKNLRPKPLSTSIGKQIGIYSLSFFVPPFGLAPGIRYLLEKSGKAKMVGVIAISLTAISIFITIHIALILIEQIQMTIGNQLNGQINNTFNNQLNDQIQKIQPPLDQLPL